MNKHIKQEMGQLFQGIKMDLSIALSVNYVRT